MVGAHYEDFIGELVERVHGKQGERELFVQVMADEETGSVTRAKCYIALTHPRCSRLVCRSDYIAGVLSGTGHPEFPEPEWAVCLAAADPRSKDIELNALARRLALSGSVRKKLIAAALDSLLGLGLEEETAVSRTLQIAPKCPRGQPPNLRRLFDSGDPTKQLIGLLRLRDQVDLLELLPFEPDVERGLQSGDPEIARVALAVLERTRNDENSELIDRYRAAIDADKDAPELEIESIEEDATGLGDWIPLDLQTIPRDSPIPATGPSERRPSLFAGLGKGS